MPASILVVLAGCGLALAVAFTVQYGIGARPCVLCLTERVPYAVALLLLALAAWPLRGRGRRRLIGLAALALAVNVGLSAYHVGVERAWWHSAVCEASGPGPTAMDLATVDLAAAMSQPAEMPPCDQPAWSFHGVTMAGINILYSALLSLLLLRALAARRR